MPRHKRAKRYMSMPPYSREAEHKYILRTVHHVMSEVKDFYRNFLQAVKIDYQSCQNCLDNILEEWEQDNSYIETWKDFVDKMKYKIVSREIKDSEEFKNLKFLCNRTSHYEGLLPQINIELMNCVYDHLYKYCISFELEMRGEEIDSVQRYETDITLYRQNIDNKFDNITESLRQVEELTPFYDLIGRGHDQQTFLEDICNTLLDICQMAKSWVKQDQGYSEQIWQEMQTYQSQRLNLKEEETRLRKIKEAKMKKLKQIEAKEKTAKDKYETHKREKKKLKSRIEVVEDKIDRIELTLTRKEDAFKKTQEHKALENPLTPRMQIAYDNKLRDLQYEYEVLGEQLGPTEKHLEKLKKDLKTETDITYEYKVEAATYDNEQHDVRKTLPETELEMNTIHENIQALERKLALMQKLRSYIAMADTLRKLHRDEELEKINPDEDKLNEVLQMVSEYIGKDWRKVYPKLPFIPPREDWKKSRDIEILDMVAMRCDQTQQEQARKAFEKWLTFSRHGNVQQLIRTLRKVKKVDLASYIEETYMVDNVY